MVSYSKEVFQTKRLTQAVAVALASLVAGGAYAQQAAAPTAPAPAAEDVTTVLVVGARASQQSAIARKKNADTAQDSIVAEDVGAFPDRNIADAISRVAGVAVDRGAFGEGVTVSIRGNGPELTRVEMDGQSVVQAGGTDMLGGIGTGSDSSGGRGVEMRQLSSDLIKSVDVVKGSTAEMTEGSLGGSVRIQTRNGLDFKKDYLSVRLAAQQNSINKKTNPNINVVGVKKFLDNRLGVLVNVTKSRVLQEAHSINQGGSNTQICAYRPLDFDKSPEKTFSFQPDTLKLDDPQSTTPVITSPLTAGGNWVSLTPQAILTKAAAAKTKAECYAAFPLLTAAQSNAIATASNGRTNAVGQNINELNTCLSQWNDWVPSGTRFFVNRSDDDRISGDIRADYKVNSNLSVFVKFSRSKGEVTQIATNMNFGGPSFNPATNIAVQNGSYLGPASVDVVTAQQADGTYGFRNAVPASGYFRYADELTWRNNGALRGVTSNVDPASVVVDKNHHVTQFTYIDGSYGVETTKLWMGTKSAYTQAGGTYRKGIFRAELLLGDAKSEFYRYEKRVNTWSAFAGPVTAKVLPNGIWNYETSGNFDPTNPAGYAVLGTQPAAAAVNASATAQASPAYTSAQLPLVNGSRQLAFQNPRINEQDDRTLKLDMSWNTSDIIPFVSTVKVGINRRDTAYRAWSTGGYTVREPVGAFGSATYVPGIYVPNSNHRTTWQVCQDTPGSLGAGGRPCAFGYNPNFNPNNANAGAIVITPERFREIFAAAFNVAPTAQFYASDPDRPANLSNGWTEHDVEKVYEMLGVQNYNLDCIKRCKGSDGQMYDQPLNAISEKVDAGYVQANFEIDRFPFTDRALPFGLVFDGNFGTRMVTTKVRGTGQLIFRSIVKTANYNGLDPNNAAGISERTYRKDTTINAATTDYLPAFNLNTWVIPDKVVMRFNWAKTIARPSPGRLIPSGTCTYDERFIGLTDADGSERDQVCTGTMGNPALKPFTNKNTNLSMDWYASKDIMLSGAVYKQKGLIGAPSAIEQVNNVRVFEGSDAIDPQTGRPLSETVFNYRRWNNQLPSERTGWEVGGKVAFTFLPWHFRYFGVDANYTRNKSKLTGSAAARDLLTGAALPVVGETPQSWNASLWYDDGALSARVALQVVGQKFNCFSGCNQNAINNYPANGLTLVRGGVYNIGSPQFSLATRYLDAKVGYKFKNGMEVFVEGRNLGKIHTGNTTGGFHTFADGTPNVYNDAYAGSSVMAGVIFKIQ